MSLARLTAAIADIVGDLLAERVEPGCHRTRDREGTGDRRPAASARRPPPSPSPPPSAPAPLTPRQFPPT